MGGRWLGLASSLWLIGCGGSSAGDDVPAGGATSGGHADEGTATLEGAATDTSSAPVEDSDTDETGRTSSQVEPEGDSTTGGEDDGGSSGEPTSGETGETGGVACQCEDTQALWGRVGVPADIVRLDPSSGDVLARYDVPQNSSNSVRYLRAPSGGALIGSTQNGYGPASIFKIYESSDDCDPNRNGTPGLQTSTGNEALPYTEEDCFAWITSDYAEGIEYETLAVTPGTYNENTCRWQGESVWAAGCNQGEDAQLEVFRYSMDSGALVDQAEVPIDCETHSNQVINFKSGSDPAGNYWLFWDPAGFDAPPRFIRVDGETMDVETIELPSDCGNVNRFTFDQDANLWATCYPSVFADLARYDAVAGTWELWQPDPAVSTLHGGLHVDPSGRLWYEALSNLTINFIRTDDLSFGPTFDEVCWICRPFTSLWDDTIVFNEDDALMQFDPDTGDMAMLAGDIGAPVGWDTRQLGCPG